MLAAGTRTRSAAVVLCSDFGSCACRASATERSPESRLHPRGHSAFTGDHHLPKHTTEKTSVGGAEARFLPSAVTLSRGLGERDTSVLTLTLPGQSLSRCVPRARTPRAEVSLSRSRPQS